MWRAALAPARGVGIGQAALHNAQDISYRDARWRACEHVAALVSSTGFYQAGAFELGQDGFEKPRWNGLGLGDFTDGYWAVTGARGSPTFGTP